MKTTLRVTVCLLSLFIASAAVAQTPNGTFDAPQIIKVGDQPMNHNGRIMYPSPAIFDIDGDGENELILGSIMGSIHVCENSNKKTGDPVWSKPVALQNDKDVNLRLNNW